MHIHHKGLLTTVLLSFTQFFYVQCSINDGINDDTCACIHERTPILKLMLAQVLTIIRLLSAGSIEQKNQKAVVYAFENLNFLPEYTVEYLEDIETRMNSTCMHCLHCIKTHVLT